MKNLLNPKIKNFRYERKFYIEKLTAGQIEILLKNHPAIFREIYLPRTVNNIYLDSVDLQNYFDNVNGVSQRVKVRIRWYGNLIGKIDKPSLEIKFKNNQHVGKRSYPLKSFKMGKEFSLDVIQTIFKESDLPEMLAHNLLDMQLSLCNSYRRKYFLSAHGNYRLTLDTDMHFYKLSTYWNEFMPVFKDDSVILELKYTKASDNFADDITNEFPFRVTRNSKYIEGLRILNA